MSDGDFALGLIIGGLIGAAVALYAPMAGEDTRRRVGERLGDLLRRRKARPGSGRERPRARHGCLGHGAERVGEVTTTLRERVEDFAPRRLRHGGRTRGRREAEELAQRVEKPRRQ